MPIAGIEQFQATLLVALNEARERIFDLQRKVVFDIVNGVVYRTPVRIGHARANWQVEINVQSGLELPGVDPEGAATVAKALNVIETQIQGPCVAYIVNNVPYIQRLEDGWSKTQSPEPGGIVAVTLAEVEVSLSHPIA